MPVFLRIQIEMKNKIVDDLAKANTGFSVGLPAILLSENVVKKLAPIQTLAYITLEVATQTQFMFHYLGKAIVRVIEEDKTSEGMAYALYYPGKNYSLIGDALLDELGVILLEPGKGYWKFKYPENIIRKTAYMQKIHTKRQTTKNPQTPRKTRKNCAPIQ